MTMHVRDQHLSALTAATAAATAAEPDEMALATIAAVGAHQQTRLNWSDGTQRFRHVAVFREWLPDVLARAPFIAWDDLPSRLMGYLVRTVDSSPDAIPIALAAGVAMHGVRAETLTNHCRELASLLQRLRTHYGMRTIADLAERGLWDAYAANRRLSGGEVHALTFYDSLTKSYLPLYFQRLDLVAQHRLQQYVLPALPIHFMKQSGQRSASRATAEKKRKSQSDILVPLLPLLVELVQFRKQSMERLWKEFHRQIALVEAGHAPLPVHFTCHEHLRSVNMEARTLGDVHLIERDVDLQFILWDKASWVTAHPERYGKEIRRAARGRRRTNHTEAYTPENNAYFVQHLGPTTHLLWFGDLIAMRVLGRVRATASDKRQAAAAAVERGGFFTSRPGLLVPTKAHAVWLGYAARPGEQLFEPDALYRGVLYGAALATLAMTSAARVNELLQISALRWRRLAIPVLQEGRQTGQVVHKAVQMLLPKGKRQERDRQVFVVSDAAFRLLMEIQELLAMRGTSTHAANSTERATIPWIEPYGHSKADDLAREPYLFQWAADESGRLGLLHVRDVTKLLRFMLHGIRFTTRDGAPIQFAIHLIRHVVATYARHEALIPPEAIAVMLHHETVAPSSSSVSIPVATEYYSKMPIEDALKGILAFQAQLAREQGETLLRVPSADDLAAMDGTLRQVFETWGSIGPTPFGWCGAGRCVRMKGRGNCIGCEWVLPDFRQIARVRQWRRIYDQTLHLAEDQGLAIQAKEARSILEWLDGVVVVMRLQFQAHLDSGYLPAADRLLSQDSMGDLLNE